MKTANINRILLSTFASSIILSLNGCAVFSPSITDPVIEDRITTGGFLGLTGKDQYGTTALTASRRMIIYKLDNNTHTKVCAEPPPDVGEEVKAALAASITLAKEELDTTQGANVAATIKNEIASKLKGITRPAGIQFERDFLASLCQLNMNGTIDNTDVKTVYLKILDQSASILKEEIKLSGKIFAASLEVDPPLKSPIILDVSPVKRYYTITDNIELKAKGNMLNAYSNVEFAIRTHPKVIQVENKWEILPEIVVKKETGKTDSWRISANLDGNENKGHKFIQSLISVNKAAVLELSIYVKETPNGSKNHLKAKEPIVIYPNADATKAKIILTSENNEIDTIVKNNDLLLDITVTPPKHHEYSFPDEIEGASLKAEVTLSDKSIIAFGVQDKLIKNSDDENYKTTLIAKENINESLKKELSKSNLKIKFTLLGASGNKFSMLSDSYELKKI